MFALRFVLSLSFSTTSFLSVSVGRGVVFAFLNV